MQPKTGDILFVWGNGLIDKAIEFVTEGPSHCAMYINDKMLIEAQGGTKIRIVDEDSYKGCKTEVWCDPTLTETEASKMLDFAQSNLGKGYDYFLILLELVHFELDEQISWYNEHCNFICSTYVNKAAEAANKEWTKVKNPAPVDLIKGGKLKKKMGDGGGRQ